VGVQDFFVLAFISGTVRPPIRPDDRNDNVKQDESADEMEHWARRARSSARCAQLRGDVLWLGVRVAEQHPQITMAADDRNLCNIQAPLKKSANGFMSKIMEAQL
jgi:hypothetical protein